MRLCQGVVIVKNLNGGDGGYSEMRNLQARGDAAGQDHRHPGAERNDAGDPERPGGSL